MTCAYSLQGGYVCCGGLDNECTVYSLKNREGNARLTRILSGHDAFVACARFIDEEKILTGSGDKTWFVLLIKNFFVRFFIFIFNCIILVFFGTWKREKR